MFGDAENPRATSGQPPEPGATAGRSGRGGHRGRAAAGITRGLRRPYLPMFPADNVWNTDISKLPVNPRSAAWLKSMNSARTFLHPDFGPNQGARLPDRLKPRRGHLHPRLLHRISNLRRAS